MKSAFSVRAIARRGKGHSPRAGKRTKQNSRRREGLTKGGVGLMALCDEPLPLQGKI